MEKYWPKRLEFPPEVIATDVASSDEDLDSGDDDDDDNDDRQGSNAPSSVYTPSSPVASHASSSRKATPEIEGVTPDIEYARFREQKAKQKLSFTSWKAELRSWTKSFSSKHKADMDLCKYWTVSAFVLSFLFTKIAFRNMPIDIPPLHALHWIFFL